MAAAVTPADSERRRFSSEFFKVFLAENSSTQLRLPPAFAAEGMGKKIPKRNATIEDETGTRWQMVIKREQEVGDLLLDDGWPEFVAGHCLVDGDFLVFRYNGNSYFNVKVFGRNGIKKKMKEMNVKSQAFTPVNTVKQEESETDEEEKQRIREKIRAMEAEPESGISSGSEWEESEQDGSCDGLPPRKRRRRRRRRRRGGQETESERKLSGIRRGLVKEAFVKPDGPYFAVKITRYCGYSVHVPITVLRANNIKLEEAIKLTINGDGDDAGKSWPAVVSLRGDGRTTINTGWCGFRKENQISNGDECVFELIVAADGNSNVCSELKVHIHRRRRTPGPGADILTS